jgi:hypothetical protein
MRLSPATSSSATGTGARTRRSRINRNPTSGKGAEVRALVALLSFLVFSPAWGETLTLRGHANALSDGDTFSLVLPDQKGPHYCRSAAGPAVAKTRANGLLGSVG